MNKYNQLNFKIPVESEDYSQTSKFVIKSIEDILADAIKKGENKIGNCRRLRTVRKIAKHNLIRKNTYCVCSCCRQNATLTVGSLLLRNTTG